MRRSSSPKNVFVVTPLLRRVERVLALFVELILDLEARVIGLDRPNGIDNRGNPALHVPLAQLFCDHRAVTRIVLGEARIPPDAGVKKAREVLAFLIRA